MVAAIKEIVSTTSNSVLICAYSNYACDEITIRLLNVLSDGALFRLYAKSCKPETLHRNIRKVCNLINGEIKFPSMAYLYKFRVVVCTLLTAGCLVRAREKASEYNSSHFSHIFVDEAACAQETVTLIPIAGESNYF